MTRPQRERKDRRPVKPAWSTRVRLAPRPHATLLFAYGTLMRGYALHPVLARGAAFVGAARGRGATVWDIGGHEYIDGLAGLWNVNVGHGRAELADAASAQMKELAYFTGYVGSSNIPAITLANRLMEITFDNMQAVFLASGG